MKLASTGLWVATLFCRSCQMSWFEMKMISPMTSTPNQETATCPRVRSELDVGAETRDRYVVSVPALFANWTNSEADVERPSVVPGQHRGREQSGQHRGKNHVSEVVGPCEAVPPSRLFHRARDALHRPDDPEEDVPLHGGEEQEVGPDLVPHAVREGDYQEGEDDREVSQYRDALSDVEEGDEDPLGRLARGREDPEREPHAESDEVYEGYPPQGEQGVVGDVDDRGHPDEVRAQKVGRKQDSERRQESQTAHDGIP